MQCKNRKSAPSDVVPSHPKYRPDIDGMRAVAVFSVIIFHFTPGLMKGGFIGVDVFFVISGYLISTIIFNGLDKGAFLFAHFYAQRIRRIFPALFLVLMSCLIFGWFSLLSDELNQLGKHALASAGFVSNLVFWSEVGYFDTSAETKPLLHLWSLGIEEQFYILFPLLVWALWKWKSKFFWIFGLIALLSFASNLHDVTDNPAAAFYSPLARFWELLGGVLLALYVRHRNISSTELTNSPFPSLSREVGGSLVGNLCSVSGAVLLGSGFSLIDESSSFPGFWALVPVLGTTLLISAGPYSWINQKVLSNRLLVWLGSISFPLYLWHWPIMSFGRIIYSDELPKNFKIYAVALTILLSWITVILIENPIRFTHQMGKLKVAVLTLIMFSIGSVGFWLSKTDFSSSHSIDNLAVSRPAIYAIGPSLAWYSGKSDWLFLGNTFDQSVAKLRMAIMPTDDNLNEVEKAFSSLSAAAAPFKTKVVLLVAPNKSTIYPEYLPTEAAPSPGRYVEPFLNSLGSITGLTVFDAAPYLLRKKELDGRIQYFRTDTHWNHLGAFFAFEGMMKNLGLVPPKVEFRGGDTKRGDLITIGKLDRFPVSAGDNWEPVLAESPNLKVTSGGNADSGSFGPVEIVENEDAPVSMTVWVVGDSFAGYMRPYFDASFKEVRYLGHWSKRLNDLPRELRDSARKPDLIIVERLERLF